MKTASVIVLIAIVLLVVGGTMNRACKSGYHAWRAPMSIVGHHTKNRPPAWLRTASRLPLNWPRQREAAGNRTGRRYYYASKSDKFWEC